MKSFIPGVFAQGYHRAVVVFAVLTFSVICQAQPPPPCPGAQTASFTTLTAPVIPFAFSGDFTAAQWTDRVGLNNSTPNKYFLCTFTAPVKPCCTIISAELSMRLCANVACPANGSGLSCDDLIQCMKNATQTSSMYVYTGTSLPSNGPIMPCGPASPMLSRVITLNASQLSDLINPPHTFSVCVGNDTRVLSAIMSIRYCCDPVLVCDAGFSMVGSITPWTNVTTFTVTVTPNTMNAGCSSGWIIQRIDPTTGANIGAATVGITTFPPFTFLQGDKYRIMRVTWGPCAAVAFTSQTITKSWIKSKASASETAKFDIVNDKKYKPTADELSKVTGSVKK